MGSVELQMSQIQVKWERLVAALVVSMNLFYFLRNNVELCSTATGKGERGNACVVLTIDVPATSASSNTNLPSRSLDGKKEWPGGYVHCT
jgi:hypothetical protein